MESASVFKFLIFFPTFVAMKSLPVKLGEPIYVSHSSVLYTVDTLTPMESGNKLVQVAFAATAFQLIVDDDVDFVLLTIG